MKEKRKKQQQQQQQKTTTNKGRKEQRGTEAIVKGSEQNDFVVHLS